MIDLMMAGADFSGQERSYSPIYSNIGIDSASLALYAHYNRKTAALYEPLFTLPGEGRECQARADGLRFTTTVGAAELAFYDTDAFLLSFKGEGGVTLAARAGAQLSRAWEIRSGDLIILRGAFKLCDARDPDNTCAFALGVRAIRGELSAARGGGVCAKGADVLIAVAFACLTSPETRARALLARAPESMHLASSATREWFEKCVKGVKLSARAPREAEAICRAARALTMNLAKAPGAGGGRVWAYPNRGRYPAHYLWDSCFQNLAYEIMCAELAADSLFALADAMRADGKLPQFTCATWTRPHESQPPLLGWAVKRLEKLPGYERAGDNMLFALEANCAWWLDSRMTEHGLIYTDSGLECGWDDSPRFDAGPILALDMNSYLYNQIEYVSELCARGGDASKADHWRCKARALGERMLDMLYDGERNLFFDALASTGERLKLITPAAFLPLWAGVPLGGESANDMITRYLLSPEYMFADIPFPSVAYCERAYESGKWWRGPTWLPVAYLMLELIEARGFEAQAARARERLYNMALNDGEMSELFDSATGNGLGSREQGWTAAIFLRLKRDMMSEGGGGICRKSY